MQRYESYKPSGIQWVQQIPGHWSVERAKWIFNRAERPIRPEDDVVTAFRDGQVTLRINRRTEGFTNAIQEHGYQGIRKGDLVIHAMDAFAGAIGVSDSDGKSTPVYAACIPRGEYSINNYFYAYLLRYMAHSGYIESLSKGIRERSTDFRFAEFRELPLPIPPRAEQDRIVKFLDQKTTEIDAAIAKKQRLIELLQEQKSILINQAVTRGINPNVAMRDSGVAWLGAIPSHWAPMKLLWLCSSIRDGTHNPPAEQESDFRLLSVRNIVNGRFVTREDDRTMSFPAFKALCRSYTVERGDVVLALVGGTTGKSAVVDIDCDKISVQRSLGILRPIMSRLLPDYLNFSLKAAGLQRRIWDIATKYAAQPGIYLTDVGNLRIAVPSVTEQSQIVERCIALECHVEKMIDSAIKEINALVLFKQILIADTVAGRIKV
jgi:type I restriction enzyme S subunit